MTSNTTWPASQPTTTADPQFASIDAIGEQDFANLLDFGSFDFLTNFDGTHENAHHKLQSQAVDMNLLANAASEQAQHEGQQQHQQRDAGSVSQAQSMFDMPMSMTFGQSEPTQPFSMAPSARHSLQTHSMIPPTPNSVEMHSDMGAYLQQIDAQTRAMIEHEYKMRQRDSMTFTPLGTPAVTPHDSQFNQVNQYAVPGEYFSPLVSPALEGQQRRPQQGTSTANPADFDVDMLGDSALQQTKQQRKARRQSTSARNGSGSRRVAQSPIQKPAQKRKSGLSSVIPPKEVSELLEMHAQTQMSPTSPNSTRMSRAYASSSDSISPEPLSEGLMGPPPKPHSAKNSPAIPASTKSPMVGPNGVGSMPATPASLMRLNPKDSPTTVSVPSTIHEQYNDDMPMLDDLILPEAATSNAKTNLPKIDTTVADGDATPRLSAKNGLQPTTLPVSTPTTKSTPVISTIASPASAISSPAAGRRPELKSRTSSKKRGSLTGQLVSPALRPKISPSIKPLLPEGEKLTEEQHALLLTSRSNYQNLIEGRSIPGVTYPSDLPSQLTSKRTSHKIAEQGRRQRINVALQEMQCLLPKMSPVLGAAKADDDDDEDDEEPGGTASGKKRGGKGGGNSKAATVENAILYIKSLQDKEKLWQKEREEREKEMELLRQKLDALERRLSVSKSPSSAVTAETTEEKEPKEIEETKETTETMETMETMETTNSMPNLQQPSADEETKQQ
ncbi:uncharacterized protein PV09_06106 [Verruconis gallopava]|uniref:BHLH domain-containing protein n=1 Tax=Verruconis gallopava TaxID=253628 RepID=A0A0D2AU56_9PEZI|nr:uncharacterized protein PV09_06106 [Verruconis gallopava]KIW02669.1 hypothetical protein PV09_06106 [Verruconis gallopava]